MAIEVFRGFLVVASLYQTIKCCCAEEMGQVLKIWLRSSVFLWNLAFFCLRGTILSFFRPTSGNIYRFLVFFLDVNRSVSIWKRKHGCIRNLCQQVLHILGLQLV